MAVKSQLSKLRMRILKSFIGALSFVVCVNVFVGPANASEERSSVDRKDVLKGFQIKPVYLLPSDAPDSGDDVNGVIAALLDEGTAFLETELGRSFPIDRTATGTYDITTIRSSYSQAEFTDNDLDLRRILHESKLLNLKSLNRKIYVFFVPVEILRGGGACGYASMPGRVSLVAYQGSSCGGPARLKNSFASLAWVHEVFHNLGIDHTSEICDLMTNEPACPRNQVATIDQNLSLYAGASTYGPDILQQGVWNGMTKPNQKNQPYGCEAIYSSEQDNRVDFFTCPIGKRKIGAGYYCWENPKRARLQELRKGKWTPVKKISVKMRNQPWDTETGWGSCLKGDVAPSAAVTRKSAGAVTYRWVVDGEVDKKFTVVWQN
jgi:hypothetical protein